MNKWIRQTMAVYRLEIGRSFFSKRAIWAYLLAAGPVLICLAHSLRPGRDDSIGQDAMIFAGIFKLFYLKLGIFFGCVGIFMNLFRGEILEKTLHYYLLSPVRREVLLAGKFLAGLVTSVALFLTSVVLSFVLISAHMGDAYKDYIFHGPGGSQLLWYAVVTVLGCMGYGAAFLFAGLVYRNPMFPAAVLMVWENINGFLPALLKKFSVIFYLKSLCPVDVPITGPMALIAVDAEPAPAHLAIPGVILVSCIVIWLAARRARTFEINYGSD